MSVPAWASGVDPNWFVLEPPLQSAVLPDPELVSRSERYPAAAQQVNYEWNLQLAERAVCHGDDRNHALFSQFADLYVFDPVDGSDEPSLVFDRALAERYRYEFVDLTRVHIDNELFRSIPVELMFRYNFVPVRSQNGAASRPQFGNMKPSKKAARAGCASSGSTWAMYWSGRTTTKARSPAWRWRCRR